MTTLQTARVSALLNALHAEAAEADGPLLDAVMSVVESSGLPIERILIDRARVPEAQAAVIFGSHAERFLAVSREYGQMLYAMCRATGARRVVEFGTSMGLSTIYLAAALRDNAAATGHADGRLIGSELEPAKVARARDHLARAGLADLVEIREGDALLTLRALDGPIDLLLLDGEMTLYLDVLKLLEPQLRPGTVILAENAFNLDGYLSYVNDPANGYLPVSMETDAGRGNAFAIRL